MTIYETLNSLKEFIESAIKETSLLTKNGTTKEPQVILGYLEELEDDEEEKQDYPYIIVRYLNDQVLDDEATLNVKLIFGVYSQDIRGWVDVLHLMEVVKLNILKKGIFDFYTVNKPIKSSIAEEQAYPYFIGMMELELTIPQVEVEGVDNCGFEE